MVKGDLTKCVAFKQTGGQAFPWLGARQQTWSVTLKGHWLSLVLMTQFSRTGMGDISISEIRTHWLVPSPFPESGPLSIVFYDNDAKHNLSK